LRRKHEKRRRQRKKTARHRDAVFLHRLQQRRLRFWRGPVDFVGQDDIGKERPFDEDERAPAGWSVSCKMSVP